MNRNSPWINTKLGNVLEQILGGGTPSKSVAEYWDNGNIPWATVKDMAEGKYALYDTKDHITEAGVKNSATRIIPKGTVIISTRMGLGRCFINKVDMAINQDLKALVPKKELVDTKFLLWLYASKAQTVDNLGTGTTVKGIRIEQLKNIDISLPSLFTQRKISAILSAYDDLIENNTRRIKILEEMAQLIYREWFVKFRFPGHEKVRMVDSELGPIPEGWEVKRLGDILSTIESGSRPKGGIKHEDKDVPSIGAENILGLGQYDYSKDKFVTREFFSNMKRGIIKSGDVLLYKDGAKLGRKSMFRDGFPHKECCINEHVFILRTNGECSQSYLFFWLDQREITQEIINLNTNAAQPGINQDGVKSLPILIPNQYIHDLFNEICEPMLAQLFNLAKKNTILRRTRDLLLPKLISGELDVEDLDIAVGGD